MNDMTWSQQRSFLAIILVAVMGLQMSAWDERDFADMRARAERAKANAVRYVVEESGYRAPTASDFHCRAPLKGERLVMQHANPREPGKGYRCTYYRNDRPLDSNVATVTWSRSPEVVQRRAPSER
jgi:hypothetical protein